jgi:aminoglycoside 6'-N-acetyltransferase I
VTVKAEYKIVDLRSDSESMVFESARLLVEVFRAHSPEAWPDMESGLEEVRECISVGVGRACVDETGRVLGWIGGRSEYDGHVWELHPLVVDLAYQGQGIGRALVEDLELLAIQHGVITIRLGTDDEDNRTSLSGIDLYPDVCNHIMNIKNLGRHPYEFYQKMGYAIVGVIPDANGFGKPDILMSKRIASSPKNI